MRCSFHLEQLTGSRRMGLMMLGMRKGMDSQWWQIAGLLLAGLFLRLLFFHIHPPISGDSLVYGDIAENLLHHGTYGLTVDGALKPTLIRLPGYPLFLALCFALFGAGNFAAAVWVQVFLSLAECYLLAELAANLMGSRAGLIAIALSALCPFTANYSVVPLTESLSTFCITLALFAYERWAASVRRKEQQYRWLLAVSGAAAFAVLLRPDRALLSLVLLPAVAYIAWQQVGTTLRRLVPPVILLGAVILPLFAWGARNWRVFHVLQPLSPKYANDPGDEVAFGFMRWYRTWGVDYKNTVEVYWEYDGSLIDMPAIPSRAFDDSAQRAETERLMSVYNDETSSTPQVDAEFAALAARRIQAHPVRYYVLLPLARLADMWFQPRTELLHLPLDWWNWAAHRSKTAFSFSYVLLNATYIALAVIGFRKWRRSGYSNLPSLAFAMLAFVLLRSIILATLDNAEQRYTMDCFPILLLLAAFALAGKSASAARDSLSC